jgi:hypothetical protein
MSPIGLICHRALPATPSRSTPMIALRRCQCRATSGAGVWPRRPTGAGCLRSTNRRLSQGDYTITLTASDSAGLSGSASIILHVTPPTGNPSIVITSPTVPADFSTGASVHFAATATDTDGSPLTGAAVQWTDDVDGVLGSGTAFDRVLSGGPCAISSHHVTAIVTNAAGHTGSDTILVTEGGIC